MSYADSLCKWHFVSNTWPQRNSQSFSNTEEARLLCRSLQQLQKFGVPFEPKEELPEWAGHLVGRSALTKKILVLEDRDFRSFSSSFSFPSCQQNRITSSLISRTHSGVSQLFELETHLWLEKTLEGIKFRMVQSAYLDVFVGLLLCFLRLLGRFEGQSRLRGAQTGRCGLGPAEVAAWVAKLFCVSSR